VTSRPLLTVAIVIGAFILIAVALWLGAEALLG
jgi:hypothetical protein